MYDLIVIGDDLSSWTAAATASDRGLKAALISENGTTGSCVIGGIPFHSHITPWTGLGENQFFYSLLKKMGIYPEVRLLNPAYQIILPEKRIDFFHDKEDLLRELIREFPELSADIELFYNEAEKNSAKAEKWIQEHPLIQPQSIQDYMDYLKIIPCWLKGLFDGVRLKNMMSQNPSFRKVIQAQQMLLSFKADKLNSFFSFFQYGVPLRGAYCISKINNELFDSLINKIKEKDGLHISNCKITTIKKGNPVELSYADQNGVASTIQASNLIVSTKWQNMHLLTGSKNHFSFRDFIRPAKVAYYPFTIYCVVNAACLPEKLARHVAIISDPEKDILSDNNLMILESDITGERMVGPSSTVPLSATVFLPDDQDAWSKENLEKTSDSIMRHLENFLPFLKENILFYDLNESIDISLKQRSVVNPRYQIRNSFLTGFASKSNKTRFRNIYLTGASLLADAGFQGELISGMNAVSVMISKRK